MRGETVLMHGSADKTLNAVALANLLCQIYAAVILAVLLSRAFLRDEAVPREQAPTADPTDTIAQERTSGHKRNAPRDALAGATTAVPPSRHCSGILHSRQHQTIHSVH